MIVEYLTVCVYCSDWLIKRLAKELARQHIKYFIDDKYPGKKFDYKVKFTHNKDMKHKMPIGYKNTPYDYFVEIEFTAVGDDL